MTQTINPVTSRRRAIYGATPCAQPAIRTVNRGAVAGTPLPRQPRFGDPDPVPVRPQDPVVSLDRHACGLGLQAIRHGKPRCILQQDPIDLLVETLSTCLIGERPRLLPNGLQALVGVAGRPTHR